MAYIIGLTTSTQSSLKNFHKSPVMNNQLQHSINQISYTLNQSGIVIPPIHQTTQKPSSRFGSHNKLPMIPMPSKNGTTNTEWSIMVAEAIVKNNNPIYNYGGRIIHISEKTGELTYLTANTFLSTIEKYICPCAFKSRDDDELVYQPMKEPLAKLTINSTEFKETLNEVSAINNQQTPAITEKGEFILPPMGYDPETKIYTSPKTAHSYNIDLPIDQAIKIWRSWLHEFPFADWSSHSTESKLTKATSRSFAVHTAACLAFFCHAMLPKNEPKLSYIYNSNSQRSGKSLLAIMAMSITNGKISPHKYSRDDTQLNTTLETIARNNSPYTFFDNLRGCLFSTALESFLSSTSIAIRPFHTQDIVIAENRSITVITGNGLEWNTDMDARVLICDLNLNESNPQDRNLTRLITETTFINPAYQPELLSCLYAFCRHWNESGRPLPKKTRAGYHASTSIIAGIVNLLDIGNPLEERPTALFGGGNAQLQDMCDLIAQIAKRLQPGETKGEIKWHEIIEICVERNTFEGLLDTRPDTVTVERPDGLTQDKATYKLTPSSQRKFSNIISKEYGGKEFMLPDGRKVKWDSRGKKRGRWYTFEII